MSMLSLDKLYSLAKTGESAELIAHLEELEATYPNDSDLMNWALISAAQGNRTDLAKTLLDRGACIEGASQRPWIRPLWKAAKLGHVAMVKFLVENGANVAATDDAGMTAIDYARRYSRREVLAFLEALSPSNAP